MQAATSPSKPEPKIEKIYSYTNDKGEPAFEVVRFTPKAFRVRYKGKDGQFVWKKPAKIFPYRLAELLKAKHEEPVFFVEGEKDADTLASKGFIATTNPFGQGEGKFLREWLPFFERRVVICIPDKDKVGEAHARRVADLLRPIALAVAVVSLDLPEGKKDVTDWMSINGNGKERLLNAAIHALQSQRPPAAGSQNHKEEETSRGEAWEGPSQAQEQAEEEAKDSHEPKIPFRPFPLHVLPKIVREYVEAAAKALRVDPTYIAVPSLVSAGGLIGNSRAIRLKKTWIEPAVFWATLIAESSTGKSPAQFQAILPLTALQEELYENNACEEKTWRIEMEDWKADKKSAMREPPVKPVPERLIVSDITIEKLADVLHRNTRGVTLVRDELSGWFASFGRYKSGAAASGDLPLWLETFRAGTLMIDRKTGDRPSLYIRRGAVSVLGTIQPRILSRSFSTEFFDCGLASRILLAMPPKRKKEWTEEVIPDGIEKDYCGLFQAVFRETEQERTGNKEWPRVLDFNDAGKRAWVDFYGAWADRQCESEGERGYAMSKLEGYCARFCLLFCVLDYYSDETRNQDVNAGHVKRARELVEWFAHEADRVYSMIQSPAAQADEERLLDFVASIGGEITPRRLLRSNPGKYKTAEKCRVMLDSLTLKGLGDWVFKPCANSGSGRPTRVFVLSEGM